MDIKEKINEIVEKIMKDEKLKKQFKESEGGNEEMCDLVENYAKERAEAAAKEAAEKATKEATEKATKEATEKAICSAKKLFENGVSYDIVRASITTISDKDLQQIYEQVTCNCN